MGRCKAQFLMSWPSAAAAAIVVLALLSVAAPGAAQNVTEILAKHPNYSTLNRLLSATGVIQEINSRSSLTILCPDNAILDPVAAQNANSSVQQMADVLRYHVLLQYLDTTELKNMNNGSGLVTTLYQTTGRVQGNQGFVNITDLPNGAVQVGTAAGVMQAAILTNITQYPYNYSFFQVNAVLVPDGLSAAAAPVAAANLTDVLVRAGKFNTLVGLLKATGVDAALAARETGAGLVLFAPSDDAFAALPAGALDKLTAAQKVSVLQYHALPAYFPLGSLQKLSSPVAATLATPAGAARSFTLNITPLAPANVEISTGVDNATVTGTLYDQPPVAIFSINAVLLPQEIFAPSPAGAPAPLLGPIIAPILVPTPAAAPPPAGSIAPTPAPFVAPSIAPSLTPVLAPTLAPTIAAPVTSPPAPPTTAPDVGGGVLTPAEAPSQSQTSPNGASRLVPSCSRSLVVVAVAAAAYLVV